MKRAFTILAAALALSGCSAAPRPTEAALTPASCAVPPDLKAPQAETAPPDEVVQDAATRSYMLALTWQPEWCRENAQSAEGRTQCGRDRFGFVVHGLWPNGEGRRHPRYCRPAPALDLATVRAHFCMTPSPKLLQHEWAAHGTCGWETPEAYFRQAQALWGQVTAPDVSGAQTAGQVRRAFVASNPGLRVDGLYLKVGSGNRLQEVRLCYDLDYRPAACASLGAPDHARLQVEPR